MSNKDTILSRKSAAEDYLADKRDLWDTCEELFHSQINDELSDGTRSKIFDPKLSTLLLDRSYRVMGQVPVGEVKGISKNDIGDAKLKSLLIDKYVVPNAKSQFDFLTKMRMVDMYSNVYGNFFTLVDWNIGKNGYIGPDVWLLNIRDIFPQVGAVSIEDSDYIIVRTWKPYSFFEGLLGKKGYKNINKILTLLREKTGSKGDRDTNKRSKREEDQYPQEQSAKQKGYFEVLTQFEGDKWTDICVDAEGLTFREIENPHDNNEIPITCKYSIPLLDDFMGMGDMERGAPMQKTINSVWNLYLDAVKMSIYPPVIINKDNIGSESSLRMKAAQKWLMRGPSGQDAVRTLNLSPQGISKFNTVYQVANASVLNMFGTSDTSVTAQTDAGFGKTPQGLQMQQARENARDSTDRFYMEMYLKDTMRKMVNLLAKKQSSAITLRMFEEEIEELARAYPEIKENYDEEKGELTIPKGKSNSTLYDYEIVSGSTYAIDQKQQQDNLTSILNLFLKNPQLIDALKMDGYEIKIGEIFRRIVASSGIQDWDKMVVKMTEEENGDAILQQDAMVLQNALSQIQGNINQIPPMGNMEQPIMEGVNEQ